MTADLDLPAAMAASLHIVSQSQIDQWLADGRFDTICLDEGDKRIDALGLSRRYAQHIRINGYYISWERVPQP